MRQAVAPRSQGFSQDWSGRPSAPAGVTLTASGTTHTLGTKTELYASTEFDTRWVFIKLMNTGTNATNTALLSNIYVGANGVEQVLIPNLFGGWAGHPTATTFPGHKQYAFPLYIPAGTRITADCQAAVSADTVVIDMTLVGGGLPAWSGSKVEALGINTGTSRGTFVTPGTTSEGSFTTIGTTGFPYRYVLLAMQGNTDTTIAAVNTQAADIGTGGVVLDNLSNFFFSNDTNEIIGMFTPFGRFCDIPSGTSLQARIQSSNTDVENRDLAIYGVY